MSNIEKIQEQVMKVFSRFQRSGMDARNYPFYLYLLLLKKDSVYSKVNEAGIADLKDSLKLIIDEQYKNAPEFEKNLHHYFTSQYWSKIENPHLKLVIDELNTIDQIGFCQNFESIVEDIIEKFSSLRLLNPFEFSQPKEITSLIGSLASLQEGASVYNPFAGIADFNEAFQNSHYYGQEMNPQVWSLGALRLLAKKNHQNKIIENRSPLAPQSEWNTNHMNFDLIVSMVPFTIINSNIDGKGFDKNNTHEIFLIEEGLKILKPSGKIILVVPNRFLFQQGATGKLRQRLVEDDILETIISLPQGLLSSSGVALTLLVINLTKTTKNSVKFVDARTCYFTKDNREIALDTARLLQILAGEIQQNLCNNVNQWEVEKNDYIIDPQFYFRKKFEGTKLADVASIILAKKIFLEPGEPFVRTRDLKSHALEFNLDVDRIEPTDSRTKAQVIEESCLLIALRYKSIKPTYFEYTGNPIYVSNDILALKIDEKKVNIGYLIYELYSNEVDEQLEYMRKGVTIASINKSEFLDLVLHIPTLEAQIASFPGIRKAVIDSLIKASGLEAEIDLIIRSQKDDLSLKKHNIMQHLNNVQNSYDVLMGVLQKNNGVLKAETVINSTTKSTVKSRLDALGTSIRQVISLTENITNELSFHPKSEVDIDMLMKEAIEVGINIPELFEIEYLFNDGSFSIPVYDFETEETVMDQMDALVYFSKPDFFELYNNVLSNAINHSFRSTKNEKFIFRIGISLKAWKDVLITFSISGLPFAKGMAERYCLKGEKAGAYGQQGIGSWKVCEIVKHFGGEIEVLDEPDTIFPVKILISLPFIDNYSISYEH
jgi:type I restriction enzyme M protein